MNEIMWGDIIFQLLVLLILVMIVGLIVSAVRILSKRSSRMNESVTNIIITIVFLVALWFALDFIGVEPSYVVPNLIEWTTKFILPWVVLYWFIRLIKSLEKK
ncbi:hypothetical protein [Lentibacillus jeotgali]|uniref:hypothetical protein n=1 Tax=Lentibacillus jeotgali TaxID=558169 RepID=UPI0002627408|nr:hypothetical protein [Lentibacillus jeotgali]